MFLLHVLSPISSFFTQLGFLSLSLASSAPQEPDVKMWVSLGGKVLPVFTKDTEERANAFGEIAGIEGKEYKVSIAPSCKTFPQLRKELTSLIL